MAGRTAVVADLQMAGQMVAEIGQVHIVEIVVVDFAGDKDLLLNHHYLLHIDWGHRMAGRTAVVADLRMADQMVAEIGQVHIVEIVVVSILRAIRIFC